MNVFISHTRGWSSFLCTSSHSVFTDMRTVVQRCSNTLQNNNMYVKHSVGSIMIITIIIMNTVRDRSWYGVFTELRALHNTTDLSNSGNRDSFPLTKGWVECSGGKRVAVGKWIVLVSMLAEREIILSRGRPIYPPGHFICTHGTNHTEASDLKSRRCRCA